MAAYTAIFGQGAHGSWSGYVPDLPTILAIGDTLDEAQQRMREAIEIWIDDMKEQGQPIPAPSTVAIRIEAVV